MSKKPLELLLAIVEVGSGVQTFGHDYALVIYLGCASLTKDLAFVKLLFVTEVPDL